MADKVFDSGEEKRQTKHVVEFWIERGMKLGCELGRMMIILDHNLLSVNSFLLHLFETDVTYSKATSLKHISVWKHHAIPLSPFHFHARIPTIQNPYIILHTHDGFHASSSAS